MKIGDRHAIHPQPFSAAHDKKKEALRLFFGGFIIEPLRQKSVFDDVTHLVPFKVPSFHSFRPLSLSIVYHFWDHLSSPFSHFFQLFLRGYRSALKFGDRHAIHPQPFSPARDPRSTSKKKSLTALLPRGILPSLPTLRLQGTPHSKARDLQLQGTAPQ